MAAYRVIWSVLVSVLGGLGAVVALLSIEGGIVISIAALSGVVIMVDHYLLSEGGVGWARKDNLPTFITVGVAVGVALAGYINMLDAVWIPGAVALVALSPAVLDGLAPVFRCLPAMAAYLTDARRADLSVVNSGVRPSPSEPAVDAGALSSVAASAMTMAELCLAWRASFFALCGLRDGDSVGRALLESSRQQYLEELENRDPAGFSRWLAAGAGPGSNPSKYFRSAELPRYRP